MDGYNRIGVAHCTTAVNDFLATSFHFRVATLHRCKIKFFVPLATANRGCCPATETNQHGRPTQHDHGRTFGKPQFFNVPGADITETAGEHNGFVIAPKPTADGLFEGPEIACECRAAELIVERSSTHRPFDHDIQRTGDAVRFARVFLPVTRSIRQQQIRDRKPTQTDLGSRTTTGCSFITNLSSGAGCSTGKWRDRRGVIMGFHLDLYTHLFIQPGVFTGIGGRKKALTTTTLDDCRIIVVSRQHTLWVKRVGISDHGKQGKILRLTIQRPTGVENFVTTMLGIGLGKHHEFRICRVAVQFFISAYQVLNLGCR